MLLKLFIVSMLLFLAYFGLIVATGQTFGQRAAKVHPWGSQEWAQEVKRLRNSR